MSSSRTGRYNTLLELYTCNLVIVLLPFLDHSYLQQEMHNIIHNQLRRYYYLISLLDMQDTTLMLVGNTVAAIAVSVDVIIVRIKLLM